jgi:hypothetical protein
LYDADAAVPSLGDAGRGLLPYEAQLLVELDMGLHMRLLGELRDDLVDDVDLVLVRDDRLHARARLLRVVGVGHDDPVVVTERGQRGLQFALPLGGGGAGTGSGGGVLRSEGECAPGEDGQGGDRGENGGAERMSGAHVRVPPMNSCDGVLFWSASARQLMKDRINSVVEV